MKKIGIWITAVLVILVLGIVLYSSRTLIRIGASHQFSQNELENAISCVQKENGKFRKIWYDEEQSNRVLAEWEKSDPDWENHMAIGSSFKQEHTVYKNFVWVLERQDPSDNWRIADSYALDP